jgi:hypothetical protein
MKTREEIRMQFFTENNGAYWTNSQEEPDIDYVHWLEDKLISKALTTPVNTEEKELPEFLMKDSEGKIITCFIGGADVTEHWNNYLSQTKTT